MLFFLHLPCVLQVEDYFHFSYIITTIHSVLFMYNLPGLEHYFSLKDVWEISVEASDSDITHFNLFSWVTIPCLTDLFIFLVRYLDVKYIIEFSTQLSWLNCIELWFQNIMVISGSEAVFLHTYHTTSIW